MLFTKEKTIYSIRNCSNFGKLETQLVLIKYLEEKVASFEAKLIYESSTDNHQYNKSSPENFAYGAMQSKQLEKHTNLTLRSAGS